MTDAPLPGRRPGLLGRGRILVGRGVLERERRRRRARGRAVQGPGAVDERVRRPHRRDDRPEGHAVRLVYGNDVRFRLAGRRCTTSEARTSSSPSGPGVPIRHHRHLRDGWTRPQRPPRSGCSPSPASERRYGASSRSRSPPPDPTGQAGDDLLELDRSETTSRRRSRSTAGRRWPSRPVGRRPCRSRRRSSRPSTGTCRCTRAADRRGRSADRRASPLDRARGRDGADVGVPGRAAGAVGTSRRGRARALDARRRMLSDRGRDLSRTAWPSGPTARLRTPWSPTFRSWRASCHSGRSTRRVRSPRRRSPCTAHLNESRAFGLEGPQLVAPPGLHDPDVCLRHLVPGTGEVSQRL